MKKEITFYLILILDLIMLSLFVLSVNVIIKLNEYLILALCGIFISGLYFIIKKVIHKSLKR